MKTDGLFLLFLSSLAYSADYAYECGSAIYYCIPREYVTVDVRSLLFFMVVLVGLGSLVFQILILPIPLFPRNEDSPILFFVKTYGWLFAVSGLFAALLGATLQEYLQVFRWFLLWLWLDISTPLFFLRRYGGYNLKSYKESFETHVRLKIANDVPSLIKSYGSSKWLWNLHVIFGGIIVFVTLSFIFGYSEARGKINYDITGKNGDEVVLAYYGARYVTAKVDFNRKTILPVFSLNEIGGTPLVVTVRAIGPFPRVDALK